MSLFRLPRKAATVDRTGEVRNGWRLKCYVGAVPRAGAYANFECVGCGKIRTAMVKNWANCGNQCSGCRKGIASHHESEN